MTVAFRVEHEHARNAAVTWARALGLPEEAIRSILVMPLHGYTPEEWLADIRLAAAQLRLARSKTG